MQTLFDAYSEDYEGQVDQSVAFAGKRHGFYTQVKADALLELLASEIGAPEKLSLLDVGCGAGALDALLAPRVARLDGVDVSGELLERARARNPGVAYQVYDGDRLPYDDNAFDCVFAVCVLHHVAPDRWRAFADELARVTRPGGIAAIVEHNPNNPLTLKAVNACPFDADAVLSRAGRTKALLKSTGLETPRQRFLLFSPFAGRFFRRCERALAWLPLGAQYLAWARKSAS
jgi:SAM-dependent methyltransferase